MRNWFAERCRARTDLLMTSIWTLTAHTRFHCAIWIGSRQAVCALNGRDLELLFRCFRTALAAVHPLCSGVLKVLSSLSFSTMVVVIPSLLTKVGPMVTAHRTRKLQGRTSFQGFVLRETGPCWMVEKRCNVLLHVTALPHEGHPISDFRAVSRRPQQIFRLLPLLSLCYIRANGSHPSFPLHRRQVFAVVIGAHSSIRIYAISVGSCIPRFRGHDGAILVVR